MDASPAVAAQGAQPLAQSSSQERANGVRVFAWTPPAKEEIEAYTRTAKQVPPHPEQAEAIKKLADIALDSSHELRRARAELMAAEARLQGLLSSKPPYPNPDTQAPEFNRRVLEEDFPAGQFKPYHELPNRKQAFFELICQSITLDPSKFRAQLYVMRDTWKQDRDQINQQLEAAAAISNRHGLEFRLHNRQEGARTAITIGRAYDFRTLDQLVQPFASLHDYRGRVIQFMTQVAAMPPIQTDKLADARQSILAMQKVGQSILNDFQEIEQYPQLFYTSQEDTRSVNLIAIKWRDELVQGLNDSLIQLRRQEVAVYHLEKLQAAVTADCLAVMAQFLQLWEPIRQWNNKQQLPIVETAAEETARLNAEVEKFLAACKNLSVVKHKTFNQFLGESCPIEDVSLLSYSAAHKQQVEQQLYQTKESLIERCKALANYSEAFEKMRQHFEIFAFIAPVSTPQFAEILSRLVVLRRDIEEAKKEFRLHPDRVASNQGILLRQFDNKDNPNNFKARFEALEEAMHKLTTKDVIKWQQAINQKLQTQKLPSENPLNELRDITAYCSDLGFEMRYVEVAAQKGAFPYKSLKTWKDYCFSLANYKPATFNWRGPA